MKNVAFIYQPHFKTDCFRVAIKNQQGSDINFIVVTCSPSYNGVWKYDAHNMNSYADWRNNNVWCKCVPINDCTYIKPLEQLSNQNIIKIVKQQQNDWFKNQIKNRNYSYVSKPDWLLI